MIDWQSETKKPEPYKVVYWPWQAMISQPGIGLARPDGMGQHQPVKEAEKFRVEPRQLSLL